MYDAIILGILQGITEWLPLSSEGITFLFQTIYGINGDAALQYSIWLHFGTAFAAIYYFKDDILEILKNTPKEIKKDNSIMSFLLISTLISVLLGALIYFITKKFFSSLDAGYLMGVVGFFLILTGLLQLFAKKYKIRNLKDLKISDGIILGLVQSFSIIPGISRSGITTSFLLFRKFQGHAALKLSFLMSIPVVLAAELGLALMNDLTLDMTSLLVGILVSFIMGLITLKYFMKLASRVNFGVFCLILGLLALLPLILSLLF